LGVQGYDILASMSGFASRSFFFLAFLFLDEGCSGREYRWESQKEPADGRAELAGYDSSGYGDRSSKKKSERVVLPTGPPKCREIELNFHRHSTDENEPDSKSYGKPQRHQKQSYLQGG